MTTHDDDDDAPLADDYTLVLVVSLVVVARYAHAE